MNLKDSSDASRGEHQSRAKTTSRASVLNAFIQKLRRWAWLIATVAVVEVVYIALASAGHVGDWPVYGSYYDQLAEAFRAGQLHLLTPPHPELLKQANPYSTAHGKYWMIDLTLYDGKYFLYWGPVPGILQALGKSALGITRMVGDQFLAFFFISLSFISGALLIERVARRLFVGIPRAVVVLAMLALAFANPYPHLLTTGNVYIVAIAGGQAFLLLGLLFAFDAVGQAPRRRAQSAFLLLASVSWALALGCRISLAPAIALLALGTIVILSWKSDTRLSTFASRAALLGVPVSLSVLGLLAYNKLRFDEWLEFGTSIQLGYYIFRVSSDHIASNLYSYLARPFELSCHFPFVFQVWNMGPEALPGWLERPTGYLINEPVVGWLRAVPITWLAPCVLLFARKSSNLNRACTRAHLWFLFALVIIATLPGLPVMGLYMATMRYLGDVTNGLVLLGILGGFVLVTHPVSQRLRAAAGAAFGGCAIITIMVGLSLGYQGYNGHVHRFNPKLDAQLRAMFSVCGTAAPLAPQYAPRTPRGEL